MNPSEWLAHIFSQVPFFGGLANNALLTTLQLQEMCFDEPSCLQLCNAISKCESLRFLDLKGCKMGSNGAFLVAVKVKEHCERLQLLDVSGISMGPIAGIHIGEALAHPQSALHTLRMPHNAVMEEGGLYVVRGLVGNTTLTELDLAHNHLTEACALLLADVARGFYRGGEKVSDSGLKKLVLSGNPSIGVKAAKLLVRSLANERVRHLELAAGASRPLAHGLRDPAVAWQYLDVADNWFGRAGLNQMFWALRQNKRLRVLKVGENRTGTKFCSNEDALLKHGIAVVRALACNVVLRELDLSFSSITTDGGINLLDALIDNRTLKRLSLRGNLVDDNIALMLMELLRCNSVLEVLDLGRNRLGFSCAYSLAESLETNRSLKTLLLDYNQFGGAGNATLDAFSRSLMLNCTLEVLDGNRLGPDWGVRLAETAARNRTLTQL
eukprot:CAMPEP_0170078548 /NCGR_PEP_ID=MMETSP0019_2-20121128/15115_1 /TAXON_ID=98059 /ORGANISM="Dinobryon sp., Strain UTEXLB2267" /LENGTH=439 /DNA_ID=CAMNT_0010291487 /DNA_START=133 /DNA_END=1450 /DNA_ORIENTATION=-